MTFRKQKSSWNQSPNLEVSALIKHYEIKNENKTKSTLKLVLSNMFDNEQILEIELLHLRRRTNL